MSPSSELQSWVFAVLTGDAGVSALIGTRVYDRVQVKAGATNRGPLFPYVTFGPETGQPDDSECIDMSEITLQLDVWSRAVGQIEAKEIVHAVVSALKGATAELASHALARITINQTRVMPDADDSTTHGMVIFTVLIEEA